MKKSFGIAGNEILMEVVHSSFPEMMYVALWKDRISHERSEHLCVRSCPIGPCFEIRTVSLSRLRWVGWVMLT